MLKMGGSHSSLTSSDATDIIINAAQSNYANCWQPASASNSFIISGNNNTFACKSAADQSNRMTLNTSCVQSAVSSEQFQNNLQASIAQQLKSSQQQLTGWLSDQSSNSASNVLTKVSTQVDQSSIQKCNQSIAGTNTVDISGSGNQLPCPTQSNIITSVSSCALNSTSNQKAVETLTNTLNQHATTSVESIFQPFVDMFNGIKDSIAMVILAIFVFILIFVGCVIAAIKLF